MLPVICSVSCTFSSKAMVVRTTVAMGGTWPARSCYYRNTCRSDWVRVAAAYLPRVFVCSSAYVLALFLTKKENITSASFGGGTCSLDKLSRRHHYFLYDITASYGVPSYGGRNSLLHTKFL